MQIEPANTLWQRDRSASLNRLGTLALAQEDFVSAARHFADDLAIAERLSQSDPANAEWQRHLALSHLNLFRVTHAAGDERSAERTLHACFAVLVAMKQSGMHLDPSTDELHAKLVAHFKQTEKDAVKRRCCSVRCYAIRNERIGSPKQVTRVTIDARWLAPPPSGGYVCGAFSQMNLCLSLLPRGRCT